MKDSKAAKSDKGQRGVYGIRRDGLWKDEPMKIIHHTREFSTSVFESALPLLLTLMLMLGSFGTLGYGYSTTIVI